MVKADKQKRGTWRQEFTKKLKSKRSKMGMGTLEVVIIIAALLTLALFFSAQIKDFAGQVAENAFKEQSVIEELSNDV